MSDDTTDEDKVDEGIVETFPASDPPQSPASLPARDGDDDDEFLRDHGLQPEASTS
jgi:hypothetical protein